MFDFMWNDDKRDLQLRKATDQVEQFFEGMREKEKGIKLPSEVKLTYRVGQHRFARDVMTAIRENQILLVQAGVGIGKSMGYLIPVFYASKEVDKFNKIVISTSSIALQQQLLMDIHFISHLLGMDIQVAISKGVNNYACLRRINEFIALSSKEDKERLQELCDEMTAKQTIDRDELLEVSDEIWNQINIENRGLCNRCNYSRNCLYRNISKDVMKADIVVTNHGNFVRSIRDDRDYISGADMFIFDEAHQLEEAIRGIDQGTLNLSMMRTQINYYLENTLLTSNGAVENATNLISQLDRLFVMIRGKANTYFSKYSQEDRNIRITDCDKIPIYLKGLTKQVRVVVRNLERFIADIRKIGYFKNKNRIRELSQYLDVLLDMEKGSQSENIYWANFYRSNKIHIGYVSKSSINTTQNIFTKNIPVVCTSATMLDSNGSYQYFKKGMSLDSISLMDQAIVDGRVYESPYNYERNSLFYYDTEITNPNQNYQEYVKDLVLKITELIRITNGRSLILFTAKSTMKDVYQLVSREQFDFNLMMQGEMSNSQICKKFETDVKSCLFATGTFWEGIDISGKSLCNVIITRLPFDNVDAITQNKASQFSKQEAFRMVYLNNMAQKMAQGTGRLIRGKNDKGIVCCLDPRMVQYMDVIQRCTPICNFTNDIREVYEFSEKYITNRDGKRKVRAKKFIEEVEE